MSLKPVNFKDSVITDYKYKEESFNNDPYWRSIEDLFNRNISIQPSDTPRIPKIIHQIWLGSSFPKAYVNWQKSWLRFNPDWEYRLWTDKEANAFEFDSKDIYNSTVNLGAKSDILRYFILKKFGGLYIDTDFECLCSFDDLHSRFDFYTGLIYSEHPYLGNGIIGCVPDHPIINLLCETISSPHHDKLSGILDFSGPGKFTACVFEKAFDAGLVNIIFPVTYFYSFPNNKMHIQNPRKKKVYYKKESMAVHHWEVSWTRTTALKKLMAKGLRFIPPGIKNKIKGFLKLNRKF